MSTAEIIAELAHLAPEDLAAVRAWLDQHGATSTATSTASPAAASVPHAPASHPQTLRLRSPRLTDPERARDFMKQVLPSGSNAADTNAPNTDATV